MKRACIAIAAVALSAAACSSARSPRGLAEDAVAAMGGAGKLRAIKTISMKGGTGTRLRLGQTVHVGDPERTGELKNVVEIVDLDSRRASMDYEVKEGDFTQHRHEVLTRRGSGREAPAVGIEYVGMRPVIATSPGGLFSWGTQNTPEYLLSRNVVAIVLAASDSAADGQPAQDKDFAGRSCKAVAAKLPSGEDATLYFDPDSKLLAGFETTDTETMLGDVPAQYILADYKTVDGVMLPHHLTIRKGGRAYSDVQFTSASINDPAAEQVFAIPDAAAKEAEEAAAGDYTPLQLTKVADKVYFAQAYSHNSMIVEFPTWLAVVEAPYTETQSRVLARLVGQQFPGKPIRYAIVTHHHYDHTGGVRGIAAQGATLVVEVSHEPAIRELMEARHTHPPDDLDRQRSASPGKAVGSIETYKDKKVIADGDQTLELYAITGSPHVDPMVIAYVPKTRVLFQSDLFFPGTGNGGPLAEHLLASIRKLNLKVDTMVGGHGGVGPFEELVKATAPKPKDATSARPGL
jgi:glyoxylase-like metal-dependent hydrolase (beta-lactamase superfamily II)